MADEWVNQLYFGDNLDVLREHIADESVDLIYLDPPFNSNATYNMLFRERSGEESAAQITAFEDTWHWTIESERAYQEVVKRGPERLSRLLQSMRDFLGQSDMMAYLAMMAPRLAELRRVLKSTGSIYLHCDPVASHYLKLLMDAVFGADNFRSEIVWRRTSAHNKLKRQYGPIHDTILFYAKTADAHFGPGTTPYTNAYISEQFNREDQRGRYQANNLTGAGRRSGDSGKTWRGYDPTPRNRHWAIPRSLKAFLPNDGAGMSSLEQLEELYQLDLIVFPQKEGGQPRYKQYPGEGVLYQDIWAYQPGTRGVLHGSEDGIDEDVKYLDSGDEKLGYDTQKPVGLLRRIIITSTQENDVVLDPFCGCGTALEAAEQLNRRWIGIDVTHLAVSAMKHRLHNTFGADLSDYAIVGLPQDVESARALATESEHDGRYQFEYWALGLIEARPASGGKKGADSGIDGYINFFDDDSGKAKRIVVQVKSGNVNRGQIATLKGDMEREKAEIGVFITLKPPTEPMLQEALSAGLYTPASLPDDHYPRVQILTIEQLLEGAQAEYPRFRASDTFKRAPRQVSEGGYQPFLGD